MAQRRAMTVSMEVTEPQALTLAIMFERWNKLAGMGGSRWVSFFVDGDGDFHPKCQWSSGWDLVLDDAIREAAEPSEHKSLRVCSFDYDGVGWLLTRRREEPE